VPKSFIIISKHVVLLVRGKGIWLFSKVVSYTDVFEKTLGATTVHILVQELQKSEIFG
jgi:hypothetical protein